MDQSALIREKLTEYMLLTRPLERAEEEVTLARRMLRARTEEEIHEIAPVLGVLADALGVSTLDMLLAPDRVAFVAQALTRSGLTVDEVRDRVLESGATASDDLRLLGFGETL